MDNVRYEHVFSSVSVGGSCCDVGRVLEVRQLKKALKSSSTCAVHQLPVLYSYKAVHEFQVGCCSS